MLDYSECTFRFVSLIEVLTSPQGESRCHQQTIALHMQGWQHGRTIFGSSMSRKYIISGQTPTTSLDFPNRMSEDLRSRRVYPEPVFSIVQQHQEKQSNFQRQEGPLKHAGIQPNCENPFALNRGSFRYAPLMGTLSLSWSSHQNMPKFNQNLK